MSNLQLHHIERLTDEKTFPIWKFQINIFLKSEGLLNIIQNGLPAGEKSDAKLQQEDAQAQRIITCTIDKKLLSTLLSCLDAKSMYCKLSAIFERQTDQKRCQLLQQFFQYKFDENKDMTCNISMLENLAHQLNSFGEKINEKMLISKILSMLPDNFRNFLTAWESTPTSDQTITHLTARLLIESQRNNTKETENTVAYKASTYKKFHNKKYCSICKKNNHDEKNCYFKTKQQCTICKKYNHKEKDCFWNKNKDRKNNKEVSFFAQTENFIVDSGSSSHMTKNEDILKQQKNCSVSIQTAKKDYTLISNKMGTIETKNNVNFTNVLFVPNLKKNLLSVNAITENDGEVIFTKKK